MISPLQDMRSAVCAEEGSLDQLDLLLGDGSSCTAFIDEGDAREARSLIRAMCGNC